MSLVKKCEKNHKKIQKKKKIENTAGVYRMWKGSVIVIPKSGSIKCYV